jgi:hypothetical protein
MLNRILALFLLQELPQQVLFLNNSKFLHKALFLHRDRFLDQALFPRRILFLHRALFLRANFPQQSSFARDLLLQRFPLLHLVLFLL